METENIRKMLLMEEGQFYELLDRYLEKSKAKHQEIPEFVNEKVALKTLGLKSKTSLWKLRSTGAISYSKMGKIILYRYISLKNYITQNEHKTF